METFYALGDVRRREAEVVAAVTGHSPDPDQVMKRAAAGVAYRAEQWADGGLLALVGGGDNGGDALYAAAMLAGAARGEVHAALLTERPHPRALEAARAAGVQVHDCRLSGEAAGGAAGAISRVCELAGRCGLWLDGILGTGARGALRPPLDELVGRLEELRINTPGAHRVVTIDVHTGANDDLGQVRGPVLGGDEVVTMGALKSALALPPAGDLHEQIWLVDLGVEMAEEPVARAVTGADLAASYPRPRMADHKYTRGVVGMHTGSSAYPGAAVLGVAGAISAGPGMIRYLGPAAPTGLVNARFPEVVGAPGRVQAIVVGSGIDPTGEGERGRIMACLTDRSVPVVVDAGALRYLPDALAERRKESGATAGGHPSAATTGGQRSTAGSDESRQTSAAQRACPLVLTPHAGEAAELLTALTGQEVGRAQVEAAPYRWAIRLAEETGAVVALKGSATIIAAPGQVPYVQRQCPAWAASAGSGDVLAGMIGAFLAIWSARAETSKPQAAPSSADEAARPEQKAGAPLCLSEVAYVSALATWLHGVGAAAASGGGPLRALDIATGARGELRRVLAEDTERADVGQCQVIPTRQIDRLVQQLGDHPDE